MEQSLIYAGSSRSCPQTTADTTNVPRYRISKVSRFPISRRRRCCTWSHCFCLFCGGQVLSAILLLMSRVVYLYPSCEAPSCWDFKTVVARSINYSASPCDNFYHFVCDGWRANSPNHRIVFSELQARVASSATNTLLRIRHIPSRRQTAVQKAAAMFKTCIEVLRVGQDRTAYLKSFLRSMGLMNVSRERVDVFDVIFDLALNWNVPVFFHVSTDQDTKDTHKRTLHLRRNRHLMEWFYRRSRLDGKTLYKCVLLVSQLMEQSINAEALIFFENYLITLLGATTEYSSVVVDIRMSDLDMYTSGLSWGEWAEVLNRHLPESSQVLASDVIHITDIEYFRSVSEIILDDKRRRRNLIYYVVWFLVQYLGAFVSLPLISPAFQSVVDARNFVFARCYEEVNHIMPYAFGAPFAVQAVPPDIRYEVRNMVQKVKDTLEASFRGSRWMDNATRSIAIVKLHSMRVIVAYPDFVLDGLDDLYSNIPDVGPVFLDTRLKSWFVLMKVEKDKLWKRLPVEEPRFDFRLTDVNAFYQPHLNVMIVPAGIINPPFYLPQHPVSVNFGGLGHVVAHEIVHGFDVESSRRDANGEVRDWWTEDTRLQYEQRVRCLRDMYSGQQQSPNRQEASVSENIADSVGLAQAHKAYQSVVKENRNKSASILAGFTSDQAFYVASCFKWCSNRLDPGHGYSTDELRCNVPLKNIRDFAEAFHCQKNDPMNPVHKCQFW